MKSKRKTLKLKLNFYGNKTWRTPYNQTKKEKDAVKRKVLI